MPASVHSQDQDQSMMDTAPQELEQQQEYEQEEFELEEKRIVVVRYTLPSFAVLLPSVTQHEFSSTARLPNLLSYRVPPRPRLLFSLKVKAILWGMLYVMPS